MDYSTWKYLNDNGYRPVEYIKNLSSTGGLNTGIHIETVEQDWEVTFKADEILDISSADIVAGYQGTDGVDKASQSYVYLRKEPDSFQNQAYRVNHGSYSSSNGLLKSTRDTEKHTARIYFRLDGDNAYHRYAYFDGVSVPMPSNAIYPIPYTRVTYCLFGVSVSTSYTGRIYSFKRYDTDGNVITNYVPCVRKSDDTPGFYDLVSDEFKTITDAKTKWEAGPDIIVEQIPWATGTGNIRLTYIGVGNGTIIAESDENNLFESRAQQITVETTKGGSITRQFTINQNAAPYNLVEWVENTNSNVLNFTDIIPDDAYWEFYGKVAPASFNSSWENILRAYTGETNNSYRIIRYNQENVSLFVNANQQANKGNKISNCITVDVPFEFHLRAGKVTIDGTDYTLNTTQGTTLTTALQINRGRWYGLTIYHNDTMVRSYHPCVDANGKYGLVDVLTGTIIYPTSGTFNNGGNVVNINFRDADRKWILTKDGYYFNVAEE